MMPDDDNLRGSVTFNVSDEELIQPIDIEWDATAARDTIPTLEHGIRIKPPGSKEPHGHN
jgi:hypothetical protein